MENSSDEKDYIEAKNLIKKNEFLKAKEILEKCKSPKKYYELSYLMFLPVGIPYEEEKFKSNLETSIKEIKRGYGLLAHYYPFYKGENY
jgi:hypothetical protein